MYINLRGKRIMMHQKRLNLNKNIVTGGKIGITVSNPLIDHNVVDYLKRIPMKIPALKKKNIKLVF